MSAIRRNRMFLGRKNALHSPMYAVPHLYRVRLEAMSYKPTWEGALLSVGFSHTCVCVYNTPSGAIAMLTCVQPRLLSTLMHSHTHCINLGTPGYCGILYAPDPFFRRAMQREFLASDIMDSFMIKQFRHLDEYNRTYP